MKKMVKKKYKKPHVTKVRLEEKISVLVVCKISSSVGPLQAGCGVLTTPCTDIAS